MRNGRYYINWNFVIYILMRGVIPPLPRYIFMAWCLVNRDNFGSGIQPNWAEQGMHTEFRIFVMKSLAKMSLVTVEKDMGE